MGIHASAGGTTITGAGIPLFRLLALRSAVKLEAVGLRTRGGSKTALAMRELGCKRKDVLARLEEAIEAQGKLVRIENGIEQSIEEVERG